MRGGGEKKNPLLRLGVYPPEDKISPPQRGFNLSYNDFPMYKITP